MLEEEEEEEVDTAAAADVADVADAALEVRLDVEALERAVSSFIMAGSNKSAVNIFPFMKFSWVRTAGALTVPAGARSTRE